MHAYNQTNSSYDNCEISWLLREGICVEQITDCDRGKWYCSIYNDSSNLQSKCRILCRLQAGIALVYPESSSPFKLLCNRGRSMRSAVHLITELWHETNSCQEPILATL